MRRSYPQTGFNKYIIDYDGYGGYCTCYGSSKFSNCHCSGGYYPWYGYGWYNPSIARNSWYFKSANKVMLFPFYLNH